MSWSVGSGTLNEIVSVGHSWIFFGMPTRSALVPGNLVPEKDQNIVLWKNSYSWKRKNVSFVIF